MMDITVKEISERLTRDAERVCRHLLPGGKMEKGDWIAADISGQPGKSLHVHLTGRYAGRWRDWGSTGDDRGDLIDLWRQVKDLRLGEAVKAAKDWLGIADLAYSAAPKRYAPAPARSDLAKLQPEGGTTRYLVGERKLLPATLEAYKIERQKTTIVFPCYGPDGALVNRSYRTLDAEKKVWQDKGCAPCLFGWQAVPESAYAARAILLCEGQIDCMTWHQWGVAALSIPNGSGQTWIEYEWENLAAFDHIYISFDMDGAGRENAEKTISRLGKHRCLVVQLPKKDANECLKDGHTREEALQCVAEARPPALKGLVQAADLEARLTQLLTPRKEPFTLPFFRLGNGEGLYLPPGDVTVWTGVSGNGKSTLLNFLVMSLLSIETPVFVASMEVKAEVSLKRTMTSFYGKPPEIAQIKEFLEMVGGSLIFADVVGYIKSDDLLEMMMFAPRRYGCQHFVIDSLMKIDGLEEEYAEQGKFLNRLQEFAKSTGVHIHLVAHPRKLGEDGKPGKMDIKGSSLIPNCADNVVAICRNAEKDRLRKEGLLTPEQAREMYDTEVRVEKQRESGWEGRFLLKFDPGSFGFSLFEPRADGKEDPRRGRKK